MPHYRHEVHILISEFVYMLATLPGKVDSEDAVNFRNLRGGVIQDYLGGSGLITWFLKKGESLPAVIREVYMRGKNGLRDVM